LQRVLDYGYCQHSCVLFNVSRIFMATNVHCKYYECLLHQGDMLLHSEDTTRNSAASGLIYCSRDVTLIKDDKVHWNVYCARVKWRGRLSHCYI